MQTVWSRVAQARTSCRCGSCAVKTSVTRHTATAAGKRPTRYLTTSTLLYSGIFAVAATTDALIKEQRRQQWDEAIAGAKEGVAQAQVRLEALEDTKHLGHKHEESLEAFLDDEHATFENPDHGALGQVWPENSGATFEQGNFAPQSLWASETYQTRGAARWSPKKLRIHELAVDQLTVRILLQLDTTDLKRAIDGPFTEDFKRLISRSHYDLTKLLKQLRKTLQATRAIDALAFEEETIPSTGALAHYSQDINSHHVNRAAAVERIIRKSFAMHDEGKLTATQLILQTLHSLATSTAPPTLGTWNHILQGFSQRSIDKKITNNIIRTMRSGYVRMNEQSLVAVMEHYIRTNDYRRFTRFVETMQGMHGGFSLTNPDVWVTERCQGRLVPVEGGGQRKVIQKPVANPIVLNTLISGVLHFDGFDAALKVCHSMGKDGWGLSMRGLTPLLRECALQGNWDAGLAVWEQIKRVQGLSARRGVPERIQSWTYATMLRLCVACDKRTDFSHILGEAVRVRGITRNTLQNQLDQLNAASEETYTMRKGKALGKVQWRTNEEVAETYRRAEVLDSIEDLHIHKEESNLQTIQSDEAQMRAEQSQAVLADTEELDNTYGTEELYEQQAMQASAGNWTSSEELKVCARPPRRLHAPAQHQMPALALSRPTSGLEERNTGAFRFFRPFGEPAYI